MGESNTPSVFLSDPDVTLWHGDVLSTLRELPAESVDCVVTSPPYWGLRSYLDNEHDDKPLELGLEPTPERYVERMVEVFREVRRVLAAHGTVWLNLGDSYAGGTQTGRNDGGRAFGERRGTALYTVPPTKVEKRDGLKPKDLVGVPWRVAFALQSDGWYLRSDIIWAKPNPMPESVTDRPTKAHEYVFLLSKNSRYFFDQEAVREPNQLANTGWVKTRSRDGELHGDGQTAQDGNGTARVGRIDSGRNIRSVWEIATQPYPEAHFATFPEELARRCIAAGCPEQVCRVCGKARERVIDLTPSRPGVGGGTGWAGKDHPSTAGPRQALKARGGGYGDRQAETIGFTDCGHADYRPGIVLDPFMGSGTVAYVARKLGRHAVGIDLNESYLELAARRLQQQSLFAEVASGS